MFVDAVVVAGDSSGTHVDSGSDLRIAKVAEVIGLGAFTQANFLGFTEVADVRAFADLALGPQMGVRTDKRAVRDLGAIEDAAVAQENFVAERGVLYDGEGTDAAFGADARVAEKLHEGLEDGVGTDLYGGVDNAGVWTKDGDAVRHETFRRGQPHGGIEVHHLGDRVGAKHFVNAVGFDGDDTFFIGYQHCIDIREVELDMRELISGAVS